MRPLTEGEAGYVIAARQEAEKGVSPLPELVSASSALTIGSAGAALNRVAERMLGSGEYRLRIPGLIAGTVTLGLAVRLGERLFATRVGVLAAALLLVLPAGRALLGTQLGLEAFYVGAMLAALTAIANLRHARISGLHAAIATGVAIAVVGPRALWLIAVALLWLRRMRGLTWSSAGALLGWTALTTATITALAMLVNAVAGGEWMLLPFPLSAVFPVDRETWQGSARAALPLVPLLAVGAWYLPRHWTSSEPLGFLILWVIVAAISCAITGSPTEIFVAAIYLVAAVIMWGFDHARRRSLLTAGALAMLGLFVGNPSEIRGSSESDLEAWATREAGRFLARRVDAQQAIAADASAQARLSYYGRRSIQPVALEGGGDLGEASYVVLSRSSVVNGPELSGASLVPRDLTVSGRSLRVIAEFGPWVLARVR